MDDISKGMFLTVLRGSISNRIINGPQGPIFQAEEDKRLNGKVLKIVTINLPFIVVEFFYMTSNDKIKRDTLDLRDLVLGTLTNEYVVAAEPRWIIPITTMFNGDPDWNYEEWIDQPVGEVIQRPEHYIGNELYELLFDK